MIFIPPNRQWRQLNSGETFGSLFGTRNINFDQEGYLKLALRPSALVYGTSNFTDVNSISYLRTEDSVIVNPGYYILTGDNSGRPFRIDLTTGVPYDLTADTNGGSIGGSRKYDALVWQGRWYVSGDTRFAYHNGNATWTINLGSLTTGNYHPMCVHEGLTSLGIGDGNTVLLYDTSHALSTTLTIPSAFNVRWIKYHNNNFYIGTKHKYGGDAYMFVWNGVGTAAQSSFPIKGEAILSGENYGSSIAVFTSKGQLLRFNGGGFEVLASLPVYYNTKSWASTASSIGRIHPRGMAADGELIYINLDGQLNDNSFLPNQPSGLWIFDPKIGLYHRAGYSNNQTLSRSVSGVNTTTDVFTIPAYTAPTGTRVLYTATAASTTSPVNSLISGNFYYLINVLGTTFKLASSYDNAIAGTAIDVTIAGTAEAIIFHNDTDFGSTMDNGGIKVGAVALISDADPQTTGSTYLKNMTGSAVLYGVIIPDSSFTNKNTLQSLTVGENRGSFVTQKVFSTQLKDSWHKLVSRLNSFYEGNDKIVVKYRTKNKKYLPVLISSTGVTWSDSLTFTTTTDLNNVSVGDEIEIVSGAASGVTVHISSLSLSAGTWTVVVDETVPGISAANKSVCIIDNWTKIGTGTTTLVSIDQIFQAVIGKGSKWIQFKVELRGVSEPVIEELNIINETQQSAV